jgi:DNA repair exonuclease SbcCD ATPase subunit
MSGFVYAYRYGDGDHVKIGKTKDLNKRRRALQGAHHNPLVLMDSIEHDDYQEGEKYIHRLLAPPRVQAQGAGSREHFLVADSELAEAFEETRNYLDRDLPRQRELEKYEHLEASEEVLQATEDMLQIKELLRELSEERARLQPELDRLDDEVLELQEKQSTARERLNRGFAELDTEEERLISRIKLAIGSAAGIDGVATWRSVRDRNRRFDPEWLKVDDPELFEAYRTAFDTARFRKEQPAAHEAHMLVTMHRKFEWINEVGPGTDE